MIKLPKRRKSKDNPYKIDYIEIKEIYVVIFKDSNNKEQTIELTQELYENFNKFELEDISQMHKYDKHIEHCEVYEETLHKKMLNDAIYIDEIVEKKIQKEKLFDAIKSLNEIQRKRIIMYYFQEKTLREIAEIENCSIQAIDKSIKIALKMLKIFLEKNNF